MYKGLLKLMPLIINASALYADTQQMVLIIKMINASAFADAQQMVLIIKMHELNQILGPMYCTGFTRQNPSDPECTRRC